MPHIAQLRLAPSGLRPQPGIWIGARFMGLVLSLLSSKVDVSSRSGGLARSILGSETLVAGPGLDQRSIHREMFIGHKRPGSLQHPLEKRLGDLFIQQALPILAVHRVIPHRLVHLHPHEPPEQQVVLQLLDQHSLAAYRIENLQQQRPKQPLRRYRGPPHVGVQLRKLRGHLFQDLIHHLADRSQRMVCQHSLLWRNVTEHPCLLVVISAHSLASLTFFTSDELLQLKLQKKRVFQQAVSCFARRFSSSLRRRSMLGCHVRTLCGTATWSTVSAMRARTVSIGSANCGGAPTKPRISSLFQHRCETLPPLAIETSSSIPGGRIGSTA